MGSLLNDFKQGMICMIRFFSRTITGSCMETAWSQEGQAGRRLLGVLGPRKLTALTETVVTGTQKKGQNNWAGEGIHCGSKEQEKCQKGLRVFSLSDRVEYSKPTWRTWGMGQILRKR